MCILLHLLHLELSGSVSDELGIDEVMGVGSLRQQEQRPSLTLSLWEIEMMERELRAFLVGLILQRN